MTSQWSHSHTLGYNFTPVPERAMQALRSGSLAPTDFVLVAFLYERANTHLLARRAPTPSLTLSQIGEGIHWTKSDDALSKRLRRLRDAPERWFSYSVSRRNRYEFTLYPEAPQASESRPSTTHDPSPTLAQGLPESDSAFTDWVAEFLSENTLASRQDARPSPGLTCPSSRQDSKPAVEPETDRESDEGVRSPQTFQRNTNPSLTERLTEKSLKVPWLPEVEKAISRSRHQQPHTTDSVIRTAAGADATGCVVCDSMYSPGEPGAGPVTCPACVRARVSA